MPRIVEIQKTYRYFDRKNRRMEIIQPGTYKIPEDISNDVAEQSYFAGVGRILIITPKKRPARNKAHRIAPENKQGLG